MVGETEADHYLILCRAGIVGRYYGPGYNSCHSVQDFMAQYPRGKGLRPGSHEHTLYVACREYQAARSRTRNWVRRDPLSPA